MAVKCCQSQGLNSLATDTFVRNWKTLPFSLLRNGLPLMATTPSNKFHSTYFPILYMLQWIKHFYKYQYSYNTSTTINSFSPELKRGGSHGLQNEYMWFKGWKTFHVQQKNRPITKSISFALSSWETTFIKDLPRNGMLIGLTQLHYLLNQGCFLTGHQS